MKRSVILLLALALLASPSLVIADKNGEAKVGRLFLFQKCDEVSGCPEIGNGPWPILPGTKRWGELRYNLWGDKFRFSFTGRDLLPSTEYTLIYYPDPWPGNGLICLGSGKTTPAKGKGPGKTGGNLSIHGEVDLKTGLPASYDANFNPVDTSGAVGAKIWLVLSDDVQCETVDSTPPHMTGWNPSAYLFEYNLIVFEYRPENEKAY